MGYWQTLRLLIFSDIHNNWKTLEHLLSVEADYYIAAGGAAGGRGGGEGGGGGTRGAGDQVTWSKGIERCGEILQARGDKVYVLPGNHESADQVAGMCARYGLHNFHERHFQVGKCYVAGLGYSSPTPFNTPGES